MTFDQFIRQHFSRLDLNDPSARELMVQLIDYWARTRDNEANNRLLHELVLKYAAVEKKLKELNRELVWKQKNIDEDLAAAAEIQKSLLPRKIEANEQLKAAWKFEPCQKIGGDIFNLMPLDDHHWAIYMLDVSGHGVPAAMVAVSVSQVLHQLSRGMMTLQTPSLGQRGTLSPAEILENLDQAFPFDRFNNFFTMNFFILNTSTGRLQYSNAGHPHPFLLRRNGLLERLSTEGLAIGIRSLAPPDFRDRSFHNQQVYMQPGDKLILYTDGVTEYQNHRNALYGEDRFIQKILEFKDQSIHHIIKAVDLDLKQFGNNADPMDDITLLGLEVTAGG